MTARAFREAYAAHRAAEGRGRGGHAELLALPYLRRGPLARPWAVRARSFERLLRVLPPPPARVLDVGAGNGWLCYRLARRGYTPLALDLRTDPVDGLGAGVAYAGHLTRMFHRAAASFDHAPFASGAFDVVVFNAALHYALDLAATLREAARVARSGGLLAIVDSPFYARAAAGDAMVREKRSERAARFGARADILLRPPFIEFLTPARLAAAGGPLGLAWRRHRVRYPLWYETRPVLAALRGRRAPSRFDVWTAEAP